MIQILEPPKPLDQLDFDYFPHDVNTNFQKVYNKLYDTFLKLHKSLIVQSREPKKQSQQSQHNVFELQKQHSYNILHILETFSLSFLSDLFNKVDLSDIRFQFEKFPLELKEQIQRFKVEEVDTGSLSGFESEDLEYIHSLNQTQMHPLQTKNKEFGEDIANQSQSNSPNLKVKIVIKNVEDSNDSPQTHNKQQQQHQARKFFARRERNLTKKQLKEIIKHKTQQFSEVSTQLTQQLNIVNDLRMNAQKDITHLREQLFKREKMGDQFKEIDVKYFDVTEGLPEKYQTLLNTKLYEMKQGYTKLLKEVQVNNENLCKQVAILDLVNKNGIRFKQMNADHLIDRLHIIEKQPKVIWETIHKYFGDDFFIESIEEEYGISPHSYDKLQQSMLDQVNSFQEKSKERMREMKESYVMQIHYLRRDLQNKIEEIGKLNRQLNQVIVKTKKETEEEIQELIKQKEINLFTQYDSEKQELYDRIRELESQCEDFEHSKQKLKAEMFFKKWIFFALLHKIRGTEEETRQQLAERTERMLIDREMKTNEIKKMVEEHSNFKDENYKLQNDLALLNYEYSVLKNVNQTMDSNCTMMTEQIENLQNDQSELKREMEKVLIENQTLKQVKSDMDQLIKSQEDQITSLTQRIERGGKQSERVTQKSAMKVMQNNVIRQMNELGREAVKNVQDMQKQDSKDVSCMTAFSGLHKPFGLLVDKTPVPKVNREAQVNSIYFNKDKDTQTQTKEFQEQFVQADFLDYIQKSYQNPSDMAQNVLFLNNNNIATSSNKNRNLMSQATEAHTQSDLKSNEINNITSSIKNISSFPNSNINTARKNQNSISGEDSKNNKISNFNNNYDLSFMEYQDNNNNNKISQSLSQTNTQQTENNQQNDTQQITPGLNDDLNNLESSFIKSSSNNNESINQRNQSMNTGLQAKARTQANSRVTSANKERYAQIYQEGIEKNTFEKTQFLQAQNIDEQGNLIVIQPETGQKFKVSYNQYVRTMSIKSSQENKQKLMSPSRRSLATGLNQAARSSLLGFGGSTATGAQSSQNLLAHQQQEDENVYKRLWNDISMRNEKSIQNHQMIQEQRMQQMDKVMKLMTSDANSSNNTNNFRNQHQVDNIYDQQNSSSSLSQNKRSQSVSHQLDEALVMLQSIHKDREQQAQPHQQQSIFNQNQQIIYEEQLNQRRKKSRQHQQQLSQKVSLNNKKQLCKIIPFNHHIMSNILGKVYIDKQDKGIQVDETTRNMTLEQSLMASKMDDDQRRQQIEDNFRMLKKVKQRRIRHGRLLSSNMNVSNLETSGQAYGSNAQNRSLRNRKLNLSMLDKRNLNQSSGEIINLQSTNAQSDFNNIHQPQMSQQSTDNFKFTNPLILISQKSAAKNYLSPSNNNLNQQQHSPSSNQRDLSVQVQWKEQDQQLYEFSLNSPDIFNSNNQNQRNQIIGNNPSKPFRQPREIHSAKKNKSRIQNVVKQIHQSHANLSSGTGGGGLGAPSQNSGGYAQYSENDMLPIHSKESFVIKFLQKNKKGTHSQYQL